MDGLVPQLEMSESESTSIVSLEARWSVIESESTIIDRSTPPAQSIDQQ